MEGQQVGGADVTKKGRLYEIREHAAIPKALGLTKQDFDLVGTSRGGIDVSPRKDGRVDNLFPFAVECKKRNRLNIWEAMRQSKKQAENDSRGLFPIVATQCRNMYLSIMEENLFLAMVDTLNEHCPEWRNTVAEKERELRQSLPGISEAKLGEE